MMHGEYKVPGGKLVVADVETADGLITRASISGDFFLEPEEALGLIDGALVGADAESDQHVLAERIDAALPAGVSMLGFDATAVATAVRRAIGEASDWHDYQWRLLRGPVLTPLQNVALDEVLSEEVAAGRRPPTLRIWEWEDPAVVIGSFQSLKNEVDPLGAQKFGVEVIRRVSGGGAMFMEAGNCITYSLYLPSSLVAGLSFVDSYAYLDDWVLGALGELGIKAWYQPINDITSPDGKIAGAAQKRFGNRTILHHVTMSYDIDAEKMTQVLRIGKEKLSDKGHTSAKKRVDPLRRQTGLAREEIIDTMVATFRTRYGLADDALTPQELALADERVSTKFGTKEWLERVP